MPKIFGNYLYSANLCRVRHAGGYQNAGTSADRSIYMMSFFDAEWHKAIIFHFDRYNSVLPRSYCLVLC